MLAPVTHILPLTTVRRERLLPVPGRVVVKLDQKVSPLEVVAEANFGREHFLIDVARKLKVPSDAAQSMMRCKAGDIVAKGQVLAQGKGLIPQTVSSPVAGRVMLVGAGQILLEAGETSIELQARLPGFISRVIPERGIEITFSGALVQGVWGNGRVDSGMILPMMSNPDDMLSAKQMDVSQRGSIFLAGRLNEPAALSMAADLPVRGMILGSISPALLPQASQVNFPIVVIDGFLHRPMNAVAYKLLISNAKREVTINAEPFDRATGLRPEIYIPLPVTELLQAPHDFETFAPNQSVRLIRDPHAGAVGTLVKLRPGLTLLPSGLRVRAGEVKLEMGEQVTVPLANLEVLG